MDEKDNDLLPYEPKDGLIELVDDFDELIEEADRLFEEKHKKEKGKEE